MKKFTIFLILFLLISSQNILAAELFLNADKTNITADEIVTVSLTVTGEVDSGKIGLSGLDKFNIIGRTSSQKIRIVNGKKTISQEQIFNLQSIVNGEVTMQAQALVNGQEIKSNPLIFQIEKTEVDKIKDELLNSSDNSLVNSNDDSFIDSTNYHNKKQLLTTPQNNLDGSKDDYLKEEVTTNFRAVQQISAFNSWFWLEFFAIILLVVSIIYILFLINKKNRKKNR